MKNAKLMRLPRRVKKRDNPDVKTKTSNVKLGAKRGGMLCGSRACFLKK